MGRSLAQALLFSFVMGWLPAALAHQHNIDSAYNAFLTEPVMKNLLVVKTKDTDNGMHTESMTEQLDLPVHVAPVFPKTAAMLRRIQSVSSLAVQPPRLDNYSYLQFDHALTDAEAMMILRQVYARPEVEFAYFEIVTEDATLARPMVDTAPQATGPVAPDLEAKQYHLNAAPEGIDARYAWTIPGGTGAGIRVLDFETGWFQNHAEFKKTFWANANNGHLDHGTAVWGEIAAKHDGVGTTGVAYDVEYAIAGTGYNGQQDYNTTATRALDEAVSHLVAGDLLVIEQHHVADTGAYAPIEYYQAIFDILKTATDKGIHCVAAAGNGSSNLDDPGYHGAFDLTKRDSGCVVVGAGGPPVVKEHLQRLYFSDYGSRVDAMGYGENVVTTGYGDLFAGPGSGESRENLTYTAAFNGTSSATPIVAGAMASVLGYAKAKGITISPKQLREALRKTGTPQKGNVNERIGSLPNLKELLSYKWN